MSIAYDAVEELTYALDGIADFVLADGTRLGDHVGHRDCVELCASALDALGGKTRDTWAQIEADAAAIVTRCRKLASR